MNDADPRGVSFACIQTALEFGPPDMDIASPDAIDRYLDYIFRLLSGAETLFMNSHYHLSTFAAITAIEETSRAHISAFRKKDAEQKKVRDPLRNHLEKQKAPLLSFLWVAAYIRFFRVRRRRSNFIHL